MAVAAPSMHRTSEVAAGAVIMELKTDLRSYPPALGLIVSIKSFD